MRGRVALLVTTLLGTGACGDPGQGQPDGQGGAANAGAPGAGQSGSTVGGTAGSSGGVGGSIVTAGSASGGAQGGGGPQLTGEALRDATYDECFGMCTKANGACPAYMLSSCVTTCRGQASDALASNACGQELYEALRCINGQLSAAQIACVDSGVTFNGCTAEQAAYSGC